MGVDRHTRADVPCLGSLWVLTQSLLGLPLCPFLADKAGLWVSKTQAFQFCLSDSFGSGNLIPKHCEVCAVHPTALTLWTHFMVG